jgi:rubrerythrin
VDPVIRIDAQEINFWGFSGCAIAATGMGNPSMWRAREARVPEPSHRWKCRFCGSTYHDQYLDVCPTCGANRGL